MDRVGPILATVAAGALVAAQPPANAALSKHVGDLGAAFTSAAISMLILGVLLLATGAAGSLAGLGEMKPEHALGGIAGAAIVLVSLITVRSLGAGGVVAAMVCAQLVVAALLDHFGALGLETVGLTPLRWVGIGLLVAGTVFMTSQT